MWLLWKLPTPPSNQRRVRHQPLTHCGWEEARLVPIPESFSGDSLTLTCTVTGNPLPRIIQWSRVNDTLPERAEILGTTLVMSRLSQSHNGTYLCQAHNNHGRAADHYTLLVYENITVAPTSIPDSFIPTSLTTMFAPEPKDPGAVVETHSAVPYAVIGGVLALLVFTIICVPYRYYLVLG
ncbi:hypothetical protein AALO_G00175550 [Alosa alosa]|uniref:Ig-like domain-containing protein n=1 Tax=Alosa alosa TaxID=278164 RepID=A0AAV6GC25_9TELE|nr:hypothetical protein AALO_G00175550 [Alosa alosa]